MQDLIFANLLFHAAAGAVLVLLAAGSALRDLRSRREVVFQGALMHDTHTVVELPSVPRAPKLAPRVEEEAQSQAA